MQRTLDKRTPIRNAFTVFWHTLTFAASLFFIIWSIAAIEFTLVWNNMQDIYNVSSTGQLIPFIVGLAGLLKTLFSLLLIVWNKEGLIRPGN